MENWREVVGFEGAYEVSDAGRVRSLDRIILRKDGRTAKYKGRVLAPKPNVGGYPSLRLGRGKPVMVHQLVAAAFLGPARGRFVCHNDGGRANNEVANLRYDSPQGNQDDRAAHGTLWHGSAVPWAKLDEDAVRAIKADLGVVPRKELAAKYGVHAATITLIATGKNWKHVD